MPQRRATIKDVAIHAGVSITTVSHVLNDAPGKRVNKETRARVKAAADQLGYLPNRMARSLRTQRAGSVAMIGDEIVTTPFAGGLILGAQDVTTAHDSVLLVLNTGYEPAVEAREVEQLRRHPVDGVLYAAMYNRSVTIPAELRGTPVVVVNGTCDDPTIPWIAPDEEAGGWDAADVLVAAGHRRLGLLNNRDDIPARHGRERGFRRRAAEAGLAAHDVVVTYAEADPQPAYEAARAMLERPDRPTGLFCFNDRVAMGVYGAAAAVGLRIPDDLSVVGFDNQPYVADGLFPGLTTVGLPHYEMGAWAAEQLFARIEAPEGQLPPALFTRLRGSVVHRGSVASPPR
jgi:LacI family transcriptional regulator